MLRKIIPFAIILMVVVPLLKGKVIAQTNHELVADVPFNFTVCSEPLPAGKYKVRQMSRANPHVMLVSNDDSRSVVMSCAHGVQLQTVVTTGKLIFNRYGSQYFLSELWLQGETTGSQLVRSEQEEALVKQYGITRKRPKVTIKVTEVKP